MNTKLVESLQVPDFVANPVWEFVNDDAIGETAVRPVEQVPVENLDGRIVGVQVQLANGTLVWASIGNVDVTDARASEHLMVLSIEKNGRWFHLSRYHDLDYDQSGPEALARFVGLLAHQVFPISYDMTKHVKGDSAVLSGIVRKEPRERLTRSEIIKWAVRKTC